jgi:hypothetical protein
MELADSQQQRLLAQLRQAGGRPIPFAELRASGIDFPAAVTAELELNGYRIDRVREHERMTGLRLQSLEPDETPEADPTATTKWPGTQPGSSPAT